jgi:hypothetical protein
LRGTRLSVSLSTSSFLRLGALCGKWRRDSQSTRLKGRPAAVRSHQPASPLSLETHCHARAVPLCLACSAVWPGFAPPQPRRAAPPTHRCTCPAASPTECSSEFAAVKLPARSVPSLAVSPHLPPVPGAAIHRASPSSPPTGVR